MVTYRELRVRGPIAGFYDASCEWTLRIYDDETLAASIAPATPNAPKLALFDGQASQSTASAPLIMRFQLVQYMGSPTRSWAVECKARLEPGSAFLSGTWSHTMATLDWPLPRVQMERTNQDFQLEITPEADANSTGHVRSLRPLNVGRYVFRGVLLDRDMATVYPVFVELLVKDAGELGGSIAVGQDRPQALSGTWSEEACSWIDARGLLMDAQLDEVLFLGGWSDSTQTSGWFELVMIAEARQWTWANHAETPHSLQNALQACQQLALPAVGDDIWHQIFSCCDYDWFER